MEHAGIECKGEFGRRRTLSLETLIRGRRTIRKFNDKPVPQELVVQLLQKAEQLCDYDGEVRWRYLYAGTQAERERLADYISARAMENRMARITLGPVIQSFRQRLVKVPANLIAIAKTDSDPIKKDEAYGTLCRILQNFQLLAWEQQLGMTWITSQPIIQNPVFFHRIGLQADERFVGMMHIGYFDRTPRGQVRTPADRYWTEFPAK